MAEGAVWLNVGASCEMAFDVARASTSRNWTGWKRRRCAAWTLVRRARPPQSSAAPSTAPGARNAADPSRQKRRSAKRLLTVTHASASEVAVLDGGRRFSGRPVSRRMWASGAFGCFSRSKIAASAPVGISSFAAVRYSTGMEFLLRNFPLRRSEADGLASPPLRRRLPLLLPITRAFPLSADRRGNPRLRRTPGPRPVPRRRRRVMPGTADGTASFRNRGRRRVARFAMAGGRFQPVGLRPSDGVGGDRRPEAGR